MRIKSMPRFDMPQERLMKLGPRALSNSELIAIIIRTGTAQKSAINLAAELLNHSGGLKGLVGSEVEQLRKVKGIGQSKACQIMASIEIAKRVSGKGDGRLVKFSEPQDVYNYVIGELKFADREKFLVIGLNSKNVIIGRHLVSIGTLNQTLVHPREVFNWAIKINCASIVVVHNHPSGSVEPSPEDILLTERIIESGKILGIKVLDHIIVSNDNYYSLKANGKM
ncbi:MAG: hypothetical protein CSA13_02095 [Clostridiales bacterium]|nr:MAG: hypothetical protein CSA13_02095 [Clostridiales bacterium]